MPWQRNADLPDHVKGVLPDAAQTRFRQVANDAMERGVSDASAIRQAWSVVGNGWKKGKDGKWVRKSASNIEGDLHLPGFGSRRRRPLNKAQQRTLYMRRDVINAPEIIAWAREQGFDTVIPPDEMHVTVAFSKTPVDWIRMGNAWSSPSPVGAGADGNGNIVIPPGGPRVVEPLGPDGAVVLMFACSELTYRNEEIRSKGASWDYPSYQPHVTITYQPPAGLDYSKIEPYAGKIVLGPEVFEEIEPGAADAVVEKTDHRFDVIKVDKSLGLVFGWAIISKVDGQDYYDLNIDTGTDERVPEHITEQAMLDASAEFMLNSRVAKEMHVGDEKGTFVFAFPLTTEIAKAMGIETRVTGLMVAMKPEPALLKRFESGELTGFSIGGRKIETEDIAA